MSAAPVIQEDLLGPAIGKVAILTGNHLCHNPRVLKEADALSDGGYTVEVLGAWIEPALVQRDKELLSARSWRFTPVVDASVLSFGARFEWNQARVGRSLARRIHRYSGWESVLQLGYGSRQLLTAARAQEADLYLAHSEIGIAAAVRLQSDGAKVGVDFEDWFSEDLLPEARRDRPLRLLKELEDKLLRSSCHSTTTSDAMSNALAAEFGVPPPTVIYNAFPWKDRTKIDSQARDRARRDCPSIHWYSQTLGPGRGLEELFAALPHLRVECELHLRGHGGRNAEWLKRAVPADSRAKVVVHDLVSNDELLSRIAEHDIGFAGEQSYCRSRDLTVTNKILHYLLGGLAVVASDTVGQREIAAKAGAAVKLYPQGDSFALAEQINGLMENAERLEAAKSAALAVAESTFCWEMQSPKLLASVSAANRQIN